MELTFNQIYFIGRCHHLCIPCCQLVVCCSSKHKEESKSKLKDSGEFPIRFCVRSLGWVRIAEEDLTPEKSSKAVNKCIVDLSLGRNDINDVVGRWGDVSYCHVLIVCWRLC